MKVLIVGMLFLVAGVSCILYENTFYQYIDEDAVLQESLFMPAGIICVLLAGMSIVYALAKKLMSIRDKRKL